MRLIYFDKSEFVRFEFLREQSNLKKKNLVVMFRKDQIHAFGVQGRK